MSLSRAAISCSCRSKILIRHRLPDTLLNPTTLRCWFSASVRRCRNASAFFKLFLTMAQRLQVFKPRLLILSAISRIRRNVLADTHLPCRRYSARMRPYPIPAQCAARSSGVGSTIRGIRSAAALRRGFRDFAGTGAVDGVAGVSDAASALPVNAASLASKISSTWCTFTP